SNVVAAGHGGVSGCWSSSPSGRSRRGDARHEDSTIPWPHRQRLTADSLPAQEHRGGGRTFPVSYSPRRASHCVGPVAPSSDATGPILVGSGHGLMRLQEVAHLVHRLDPEVLG